MTKLLEQFSVIHRVNGEAGESGENSVFPSSQESEIPRRQTDSRLWERLLGNRQTSCRRGLFWLVVSETSVHGCVVGACSRGLVHLTAVRKERDLRREPTNRTWLSTNSQSPEFL